MTDVYACDIELKKLSAKTVLAILKWICVQNGKNTENFTFEAGVGKETIKSGTGPEKMRLVISDKQISCRKELLELYKKKYELYDEKSKVIDAWDKKGKIPAVTVYNKNKFEITFWSEWPKELEEISKHYDDVAAKINAEIERLCRELESGLDTNLRNASSPLHLASISFSFCFSKEELANEPAEVQKEILERFPGLSAGAYWVKIDTDKITIAPMFREEILFNSRKVRSEILQLCKEIKPTKAYIYHTSDDPEYQLKNGKLVYPEAVAVKKK